MSDETTQANSNTNAAINYTTIFEKLNALDTSRQAIINVLNENGAEVPTETKLSELPEFILNQVRYAEPIEILNHQTVACGDYGSANVSAVIAENGLLKIHYAAYSLTSANYKTRHIIWLNNINDSTESTTLFSRIGDKQSTVAEATGRISANIIHPITSINEDVSSHLVLNLDFAGSGGCYCAILAELYK